MMRKIQFFVLIEAILLTMAFITIVANDFSQLILLSILFLLFLYYYLGRQRGNNRKIVKTKLREGQVKKNHLQQS